MVELTLTDNYQSKTTCGCNLDVMCGQETGHTWGESALCMYHQEYYNKRMTNSVGGKIIKQTTNGQHMCPGPDPAHLGLDIYGFTHHLNLII